MLHEPVLAVAAVVVALGVIIGAIYKIYKVAHRIDAALGVDAHGRTVADRLSRVEHQLWPNGGSSLPDKISRLEDGQIAQTAEMRVMRNMLTSLVERR
jgi:hypothetical protein